MGDPLAQDGPTVLCGGFWPLLWFWGECYLRGGRDLFRLVDQYARYVCTYSVAYGTTSAVRVAVRGVNGLHVIAFGCAWMWLVLHSLVISPCITKLAHVTRVGGRVLLATYRSLCARPSPKRTLGTTRIRGLADVSCLGRPQSQNVTFGNSC